VDALERRVFFDELHAGYTNLRQDSAAWGEIAAERGMEEHALPDGSL
jgi:hypothetical protein